MLPKKLKLMADYQCFPLWGDGDNIDPASLPISDRLCEDLMTWALAFDATLVMDDPLSSGFPTEVDELEFKREGHRLKERLQAELGARSCVTSFV
ncbi:MAG: hypothetical protein EOP37_23695 [Rubrivivax sp.]|nr:MAG: hypothetical protein EOP37_23695 [Rubrivivax sp.]